MLRFEYTCFQLDRRCLRLFLLRIAITLLALFSITAQPGVAQTLKVNGPKELMAALASVTGGETILLAAGSYGTLKLNQYIGIKVDFAETVTIASADPSNPAVFSGLGLSRVSNLTLQSVVFDYTFTEGDTHITRHFVVDGSRNVTIRDSLFDGDIARNMSALDDGRGMATGLSTTDTENLTLSGNEFRRFFRAVLVTRARNIRIIGNDIHSQRSEGLNIAASQVVLIEANHIHSFDKSDKSGDHPDMIQFWTTGTKQPSQDVVIRGNLLDAGGLGWTQSIFINNELVAAGQAGRDLFYRNVLIEDNVIFNAHLHGISVGETDGLTIRNNTLIHDRLSEGKIENPQLWRPRINVSSDSVNVDIRNNVTFGIVGPEQQPGWTLTNNVIMQDLSPLKPDWYGRIFTDAGAVLTARPEAFFYAAEGGVDGRQIGSGLLRSDRRNAEGMIDVASVPVARPSLPFVRIEGGSNTSSLRHRIFHAVATQVGPSPLTYRWFVEGTSHDGESLEHRFADPGYYPVTLAVFTDPNKGPVTDTTIWIEIPEEHFLSFNSQQDSLIAWQTDGMKRVDDVAISADGEIPIRPDAIQKLPAQLFTPLVGADTMRLSLRFRADPKTPDPSGDILHLQNVLSVALTSTGGLEVRILSEKGAVTLGTQALRLNNGAWHDIELTWDAPGGVASLFLDGTLRGKARTNGHSLTGLATPLATLGHPGSGKSFSGTINRLDLYAGDVE